MEEDFIIEKLEEETEEVIAGYPFFLFFYAKT